MLFVVSAHNNSCALLHLHLEAFWNRHSDRMREPKKKNQIIALHLCTVPHPNKEKTFFESLWYPHHHVIYQCPTFSNRVWWLWEFGVGLMFCIFFASSKWWPKRPFSFSIVPVKLEYGHCQWFGLWHFYGMFMVLGIWPWHYWSFCSFTFI